MARHCTPTVSFKLVNVRSLRFALQRPLSLVPTKTFDPSGESAKPRSSPTRALANYSDNLEEVFENREQIEISKFYERLPKHTLIALDEFERDQIYVRNTE